MVRPLGNKLLRDHILSYSWIERKIEVDQSCRMQEEGLEISIHVRFTHPLAVKGNIIDSLFQHPHLVFKMTSQLVHFFLRSRTFLHRSQLGSLSSVGQPAFIFTPVNIAPLIFTPVKRHSRPLSINEGPCIKIQLQNPPVYLEVPEFFYTILVPPLKNCKRNLIRHPPKVLWAGTV